MLEKTSAELRASDALRLTASIEQQRIANNSVPFAEIVAYGTEAALTPVKTTTIKFQLEWQQRDEVAAVVSERETIRLAIEQEFIPKKLKTSAGASLVLIPNETVREADSEARKFETAVQWSPLAQTAVTLGAELATREAVRLNETVENYALKLQRQLFPGSTVELQAGYEQRWQDSLSTFSQATSWNLGARSDFGLRDDWMAGVGLRYRLRDEAPLLTPTDELSLTLSLKGRF